MNTTRTNVLLSALLVGLAGSAGAQEEAGSDHGPGYTLSLKAWNASWATTMAGLYSGVAPAGTPQLIEALDSVDGKRKTSVIPSFSVAKNDFVVTVSHARYATDFLASTSVLAPTGANIATSRRDHIKRKESDLSVSYFVVPELAVSLAYKHATEERTTLLGLGGGWMPAIDNKARALLLGVSAVYPIRDNLSFTGQVAFGPARIKTRIANPPQPEATNHSRYVISEIGVRYALPVRENGYVSDASIGLGYRSQLVRSKAAGPAGGQRIYRDEREGIVLSLNVSM